MVQSHGRTRKQAAGGHPQTGRGESRGPTAATASTEREISEREGVPNAANGREADPAGGIEKANDEGVQRGTEAEGTAGLLPEEDSERGPGEASGGEAAAAPANLSAEII